MAELITLGETMVLLKPFHGGGRLKSSQVLSKSIGGAESNVAIGVSRLGHESAWISKVGRDPFGEEILYTLNAERVDTRYVSLSDAPTGIMFKERIRDEDSRVYYYRERSAASTLQVDDVREDMIRGAKLLHLTGITPALSASCRDVVTHAMSLAKRNSVRISFDPNLRLKLWSAEEARATLLPMAREADFFFPGLDEARLLLNRPEADADEVLDRFLDMGIPTIVLKLGPSGCIYATSENRITVPGFKVTEIDSVGAGDGFCAGFLTGYLEGWEPAKCAELANAVGALAVTAVGDYEALPTMEEVEQFLGKRSSIAR
ncbi:MULTISPECIES: sugar kinase [Alicyclobacillus]|uniref:Sugar kinase n=1 Tax=Alicyclobacillus acidoterrestris (strain ATCC 49025 / DSM 3922 / CIP 106132 / NCIMB 13137 / GD3B) TaxID=1356854 RepID=T0D3D6_ALIAG|nr:MULTISPECIES: sugar kinase [Alicyclobacillus]EPZ46052.1 hypothetical protein N007_00940 [Alicyclobacillus acidoterrestris ATCC 49025]UNO48750.1 sugar kinase [Alicyclobacillus acidoterrestris]